MADDKPIDRRRFFRSGLSELLKPLARAVKPLEAIANELGKLEEPPAPKPRMPEIRPASNSVARSSPSEEVEETPQDPSDQYWVRPPGALPEQQFLETCSRCSECVRVCPVQAIILDPSGINGAGAPYIDIESQSCVMCENLECMHRCPTGALVGLPRHQMDIGTAEWHEDRCLRTSGGYCTVCVDHCPVGNAAIEFDGDRVVVHETGCTGCGVCQHDCPTWPKSITVTPKSQRDDRERSVNQD